MWSSYRIQREGGIALRSDFDPDNPLHIYWPPDVIPPEIYSTTTGRPVKFKKIQIIVCTTVKEIENALIRPRVWYQAGEWGADKPGDEYDLYLYHDTGNHLDTKIISWGSLVRLCGKVMHFDEAAAAGGEEKAKKRVAGISDSFLFHDATSVLGIMLRVFFDPHAEQGSYENSNRNLLLAAAKHETYVEIVAHVVIIIYEGKRYKRLNLMRAFESTAEHAAAFPHFCDMINKSS